MTTARRDVYSVASVAVTLRFCLSVPTNTWQAPGKRARLLSALPMRSLPSSLLFLPPSFFSPFLSVRSMDSSHHCQLVCGLNVTMACHRGAM